MVVKQEIEREFKIPCHEIAKNVLSNLVNEEWRVVKTKKLETKSGSVYEIIGASAPFAGWTVSGHFLGHNILMIPFFIQISSTGKEKCSVYAIVVGSDMFGEFDFGSNVKIVKKLEKFFEKATKIEKAKIINMHNIPKGKIRCYKCGHDNPENTISGHCDKCETSLYSQKIRARFENTKEKELKKHLRDIGL